MSYPYKTIGASSAAVASILALGTILWTHRTTRPDMPRPQDEAAIMHAILERQYAMGRTNFQYTTTIPANVSQVITGSMVQVRVTSSLTLPTTAYAVIYAYDPSLGFDYGCAFDQSVDITLSESAGVQTGTLTNQFYGGYSGGNGFFEGYDATITHPTGGVWTVTVGGGYATIYWRSPANALPQTLAPFNVSDDSPTNAATYGALTITANTANTVPLYGYITNSPAVTWTNTIGLFPNAEFRYPDGVRAAILPSGTTNWILPDDSFMTTGVFDDTFHPPMVYDTYTVYRGQFSGFRLLNTDTNWWTNWVTSATANWVTQTNYWDGTVITWTNGVCYT